MTGLGQHTTKKYGGSLSNWCLTWGWMGERWRVTCIHSSPLPSLLHPAAREIYLKFTQDALFLDPNSFNSKLFWAHFSTLHESLSVIYTYSHLREKPLHTPFPMPGNFFLHSPSVQLTLLKPQLTHFNRPR